MVAASQPRVSSFTSSSRAQRGLLLFIGLCLALLPLREAWLDPAGRTLLAPDTATVAPPWSAALAEQGALVDADGAALKRPRNGGLSDQGLVFYPHYRYLSDQLRAGEVPLWNPLNYTGAPLAGNPQAGLFDPQVWLPVGLDLAFGQVGFQVGLVLGYSLRIALAFFGCWLLARRLGLEYAGALLAAVGFACSGYLQVWLGAPLSHVTPFLPWVLLGVERCTRAPRTGALLAAASLALAIYGGHPETAFYVGAAAGIWSLSLWNESRAATLWALGGLALGSAWALPSLLPFVEYLGESAAQLLRERAASQRGIDLAAVGATLVGLLALASLARQGARASFVVQGVGGMLVAFGLLSFMHTRGLPPGTLLSAFPEAFGHPGRGGYRGPGLFLEEASSFLPAMVLVLAVVGSLAGRGILRKQGLVLVLGLLAFGLVLRVPGLLDLKQRVPLVGLGATVRLAAVSGLLLSLLAGAGLQALQRGLLAGQRGAALGLLLGALAGLWGAPWSSSKTELGQLESDPLFGLVLGPAELESADSAPLEGWVVAGLPVDSVRLLVRPMGSDALRFAMPAELFDAPSSRALSEAPAQLASLPEDARFFRTDYLQLNRLDAGAWSIAAEFVDAEGSPLAERELVRFELVRLREPGTSTWLAWLAALGSLAAVSALGAGSRKFIAPWAIGWALFQGLWFAEGLHPAVPVAEAFPHTATEQELAKLLAERPGGGRYLSDPSVMLPSSGLVRGLAALDGYDGMEPADYAQYRPLALKPGVSPLLGWNARGVNLDAPTFQQLGVHALVTTAPLEHPGWELVAGPDREPRTECYLYRATDPLPRVLAPTEVVEPLALLEQLQAGADWDPRRVAAVSAGPVPEPRATSMRVSDHDFGPNHHHFTVDLDGHAFVVLTDLYFPGWSAAIDERPAKLWKANALFRGVYVEPGEHRISFNYRPLSLRLGALGALAASLLAALLLVLSRKLPTNR